MNRVWTETELDRLYPATDGVEMGESVEHINLLTLLYTNFKEYFLGQNVSVHAELFWYPVEGQPHTRRAPDVMIIFDCPLNEKRKSYRQWMEGNKPATVVIEILSASNDDMEMKQRRAWYRRYGVQEYYEIEEDTNRVNAWLRREGKLVKQNAEMSFTSPRLGVTFDWSSGKLVIRTPDGNEFADYHELQRRIKEERRRFNEERLKRREAETQKAEEEKLRREEEKLRREAEAQKAEEEKLRREAERKLAELQQQLEELRKQLGGSD